MRDFLQFLRETSYPGRGIAVGRDRVSSGLVLSSEVT